MKVIYETVEEAIRKAVYAADLSNRRIARIELSIPEANELNDAMRKIMFRQDPESFMYYTKYDHGKHVGAYMGVRVQIEDAPKAT